MSHLVRNDTNLERGAATALFMAVLMPFLFVLLSITVDVSTYYTATRRMQQLLDDASIYGQQFLPYKNAAEEVIASYLTARKVKLENLEISVSTDVIELRYSKPLSLFFTKLINSGVSPEVTAKAVSRSSVQDISLLLDTSSYMAPDLYGSNTWGDSLRWRAASLFEHDYPIYYNGVDGITRRIPPEVVTQQCFNPHLSALKLTAAKLYQRFASSRLNSTGVAFGPDEIGMISIGKPSSPEPPSGVPGISKFKSYRGVHIRGELCLAAAEREVQARHYSFPSRPTSFEDLWTPPRGAPSPRVVPGDWRYDQNYNPYLTAEELIWGQAAATDGILDIQAAIRTAVATTLTAPNIASRRGLNNHQQRIAFILLGDLPHIGTGERYPAQAVKSGLAASLEETRQKILSAGLSLKLIFLILKHPAKNDGSNTIAALRDLIEGFYKKIERTEFSPHLYFAHSPDILNDETLNYIANGEKRAVLSR